MAGKIIADQIEHSTAGSLDTQYVVNGSAKAWSRVAPNTISDSLNVSSLTDAGTGLFEDNFLSAFSAANYSSVASPAGNINIQVMFATNMTTYTTTASRTSLFQNATGYVDETYSTSRMGDLA